VAGAVAQGQIGWRVTNVPVKAEEYPKRSCGVLDREVSYRARDQPPTGLERRRTASSGLEARAAKAGR
jgi:hypothetical protein